jgi:hypothetical protein
MHPAVPVTAIALAGVCLTVQPGREMIARYARFTVAFFLTAPFVAWIIVAFLVTVAGLGVIPLAVVTSACALTYRWTLRPIVANARIEARTASARRQVRRQARRNPTAGTVLAAASHQGAMSGRQHAGQALDLPASDTGTYMLVLNNGVTELQPVNL